MHSRASSTARRSRAPSIHLDTSAVTNEGEAATSSAGSHDKKDVSKLGPPSWTHPTASASSPDTLRPSSEAGGSSISPKCVGVPSRESMEELFRPIPDDEEMFKVDDNPFAFNAGHLSRLLNPKNLRAFLALGGLAGIEKGLRTDAKAGLSPDETDLSNPVSWEDATGTQELEVAPPESPTKHEGAHHHQHRKRGEPFSDRKRIFGVNVLPERKSKSFLLLVWIALQDKVLILLSIAAAVSLALGLYQTFGAEAHEGGGAEWIEGVAIIVAIAVVSLVGALNDWKKERQFQKLNKKKEDRDVKVIRSGRPEVISINDILVGDVLKLEQGDVIPVDGIFIDGHNISCDESSATGESDHIKKTPAAAALKALQNADQEPDKIKKLDPFIISGAKVLDGVGTCLVTAVGPNSSHGRTMLSLRDDSELTPLQLKLNVLAGYIAKLGSLAGLLLFTVLFIEFLVHLKGSKDTPDEKGQKFMGILITAITIIVVAVPEGLPLAVTLALSFATKKMTKENNLVRHLQSCETMGNATVICSDKTGTLTENVMTVVAGSLGNGSLAFGDEAVREKLGSKDSEEEGEENAADVDDGVKDAASKRELMDATSVAPKLDKDFTELLRQSIGINTTAFEGTENGKNVFVGTKTETALLDWAKASFALDSLEILRSNHPVVEMYPFNSSRKCMGAVIQLPDNKYRIFVKGAPEILLAQCHKALDAPTQGLRSTSLDQMHHDLILQDISKFASLSLRTLGLCFRDVEKWPPSRSRSASGDDSDTVEFKDVFREMTWIGAVGIQDPVRQGVPEAIKNCSRASVSVKMVTGDNIQTATAIAKACGLLDQGGKVMEGLEFRRMNEIERDNIVGDIRVLARSSPEDKRVLVRALQSKGQIVAVTGDGTNDAPALKAADVGFSMGITGTEVAKEASDIILLDDNFTSIVVALSWGRAINDAVKKFLQFQITVNITAVLLTFVSAVSNDNGESVLTAVQLLWVNLIMDTFAALALATDPPNDSLLDREPEPKTAPLITLTMWKMIIGQSIFQLTVTFVLYFAGPHFLNYPEDQLKTLVFNTFVFMQIFKLVNSRRIDNRLNIFEGLSRNYLFMLMAAIMVGGQVLIVFVGSTAFSVTRITGAQWGISLVLGFLSIPVGILIRLFPDAWVRACIPSFVRRFRRGRAERNGEDYDLNAAMLDVRDDLALFNRLRGGRMAFLCDPRFLQKQIERARRRGSTASTSPMHPAVGMSGLLAASIGGLPSPDRERSVVSAEGRPTSSAQGSEARPGSSGLEGGEARPTS